MPIRPSAPWTLAVAGLALGAVWRIGLPATVAAQQQGPRHALVIGIDSYPGAFDDLSKAVEDAEAVANALPDLGFDVALVTDSPHDPLVRNGWQVRWERLPRD